jgi:transposase
LRHYPKPQDIVEGGLEALSGVLKRISRGKLESSRAAALFQAAQQSVGVREGERGMLLEIQELLSQIETSDCFIKRLEQEMEPFLDQIPYLHSILSVKGIGKITAAGLIGEVGDFRKFRIISEILKLAGLDLFEISSGQHRGNRHISKRGRSLLRRLLFFATLSTIRKGGVMYLPYQRYIQRGMPKGKAVVAIARKLLRILFALIRDHTQFKENYSNLENLKLAA